MKCDEEKPFCRRCQSTGRTCDGYSTAKIPRYQVTTQKPTSTFVLPRTIFPKCPGSYQERRCFSYFHNRTATMLAGYFDSKFWEQLILQISVAEPAIRHGIVALGSLHEARSDINETDIEHNLPDAALHFSLQQYNKSIAYLNNHMSVESGQSVEVVLMCCMLFISFESLQGNHDSSRRHLVSGAKILSQWQSSNHRKPSTMVEKHLLPMFTRLNVQIKALIDASLFDLHIESLDYDLAPKSFSDLQEASNFFYILMDRLFDLIRIDENHISTWSSLSTTFVDNIIVSDQSMSSEWTPTQLATAQEETQKLKSLFCQWLSRFDAFLSQSTVKMDNRELSAAILLRLHYTSSWLLLITCGYRLESVFDQYRSQFEQIVSLSTSLITVANAEGLRSRSFNIWLDMGVIPPLYYAATRCRDPLIRRRAIQLLRRPRTEGAWDAGAAALVAERLCTLEEEGLVMVKDAKDVPESARIHVLKAVIDLEKREIVLLRRDSDGTTAGKSKTKEIRISW